MENIYLLTRVSAGGIREVIATASTREDLAAIADKVVSAYVKSGLVLAEVHEAGEAERTIFDVIYIYKVYYLKRTRTRKTPPGLVILEMHERPIDTPTDFEIDDLQI